MQEWQPPNAAVLDVLETQLLEKDVMLEAVKDEPVQDRGLVALQASPQRRDTLSARGQRRWRHEGHGPECVQRRLRRKTTLTTWVESSRSKGTNSAELNPKNAEAEQSLPQTAQQRKNAKQSKMKNGKLPKLEKASKQLKGKNASEPSQPKKSVRDWESLYLVLGTEQSYVQAGSNSRKHLLVSVTPWQDRQRLAEAGPGGRTALLRRPEAAAPEGKGARAGLT